MSIRRLEPTQEIRTIIFLEPLRLQSHVSQRLHQQYVFLSSTVQSSANFPCPTEKVLILTVDGRTLLGTLLSTDQLTNLVLLDTIERIIRTPDDPEPSSQIEHGLYLIRGDNVVVCGEVDEGIDNDIDWSKVKGEVVRSTKNA